MPFYYIEGQVIPPTQRPGFAGFSAAEALGGQALCANLKTGKAFDTDACAKLGCHFLD